MALLWDAHQRHGQALGPDPGTSHPHSHRWVQAQSPFLRSLHLAKRFGVAHSPAFQALYLPSGQPPPADQPFRNPALARTLSTLAREGGPAFYAGPLAQQILGGVNALKTTTPNFLGWSASDLSSYAVVRRPPLCSQQLGHRICTMPPPSSGGIGLLQTLALLNQSTPLAESAPDDPTVWRQLGQAQAWADADRLYWVHDPVGGSVPAAALLDPAYIKERAAHLQGAGDATPEPGLPPGVSRFPLAGPQQGEGTTQMRSWMPAATSPPTPHRWRRSGVGTWWRMVLNNQLTDFAFVPTLRGCRWPTGAAGPPADVVVAPTWCSGRASGAGPGQPRRSHHSPPTQWCTGL